MFTKNSLSYYDPYHIMLIWWVTTYYLNENHLHILFTQFDLLLGGHKSNKSTKVTDMQNVICKYRWLITISEFQAIPSIIAARAGRHSCRNTFGFDLTECELMS